MCPTPTKTSKTVIIPLLCCLCLWSTASDTTNWKDIKHIATDTLVVVTTRHSSGPVHFIAWLVLLVLWSHSGILSYLWRACQNAAVYGTKYNPRESELIIFEGFLIKENVRPLRHKYIFPAKLPARSRRHAENLKSDSDKMLGCLAQYDIFRTFERPFEIPL